METITLVVCSRLPQNQREEYLNNVNETCGTRLHIMYVHNPNGMSLTTIYSDMLQKCDTDIVVFAHDDIEFLRKGWGLELTRLFKEYEDYGIIGVAGSAEFDENAAWWQYKKIYGQVLHRHDGKSWLTTFSPLLKEDLKEVCVVDGLFFAVHKSRITKDFDKSIEGFNFYEVDFCLSNFLDGQTKIGVTTNIRLAHSSIGETKANWFENREKINEKYNGFYPITVQ